MQDNNIINHLKQWCKDKAKAYQKVYGNYGGITYVGYLMAYELEFKLSTLIDKPFESVEELKSDVLNLVDIHYEPSLKEPQDSLAQYIIDKINREFREFLEDLFSRNESLVFTEIPYMRVIVGPEAAALQEKFRSVWDYVNTSCWFPLMGDEPQKIADKFFVMLDHVEPYLKQIEQIIGLPQTHIYEYGEYDFRPPYCIETDALREYGGCEMIYTDKDFSWAIYFSHENTVAFAGSIVTAVKELLSKKKEFWDKFQWGFE